MAFDFVNERDAQASGGIINITATIFGLNPETASLFTKINNQNYTLEINSGTLELKDNKVIVLAD